MIFVKGVLGGLAAVVVMWIAIVSFDLWRVTKIVRQQDETGPIAVANGWDYLLHSPAVVLLLTAAFGIGLYLATRWT